MIRIPNTDYFNYRMEVTGEIVTKGKFSLCENSTTYPKSIY